MIQGTGSHVGKSVLVAGLGRALARRGLTVRPFKPQNMSNNAAVTADGGEIGRAQALQARACGRRAVRPHEPGAAEAGDRHRRAGGRPGPRVGTLTRAPTTGAQGRRCCRRCWRASRSAARGRDLVLVEGAGSPAEVNLRAGDIANMGFAEAADVPVVLVGDIDRGGVIASLVGTHACLTPGDAARIAGFIINKFRGDAGAVRRRRARRSRRGPAGACLGVVPWFATRRAACRPRTCSALTANRATAGADRRSPCRALPRIANFDDLDPLRAEPGVSVVDGRAGRAAPGDGDLVLLPGSKVDDRRPGVPARARAGTSTSPPTSGAAGAVLGLCGGYQMLGRTVADPDGIEGPAGDRAGLGLLDVETVLAGDKTTVAVDGRDIASGEAVAGYEMHIGRTSGPDAARPLLDSAGGRWRDVGGRAGGRQLRPRPVRRRRFPARLSRRRSARRRRRSATRRWSRRRSTGSPTHLATPHRPRRAAGDRRLRPSEPTRRCHDQREAGWRWRRGRGGARGGCRRRRRAGGRSSFM